jgi:hypothetical protein
MQMLDKRTASRRASRDDLSSGDSSSRDDDFMIAPHPRRVTSKVSQRSGASSSQADEAAANIAKGQAVHEAREARESEIIQKAERPLRADYEYSLRRVDHRHPRMPIDFTRGENQSMISCDRTTSRKGMSTRISLSDSRQSKNTINTHKYNTKIY